LTRVEVLRERRAALELSGHLVGARVGELIDAGFEGRDSPGSIGRAG